MERRMSDIEYMQTVEKRETLQLEYQSLNLLF